MWPGHYGGAFSTVQVHEGGPSSALTSALANNETYIEQNQSSGLQPLHKCTFCGAAYRYRCRLLRHNTAMHGGTRFVCPQCQCTLASRRGLTEHVKIVHQKLAIYQCPHCGKGYSHRSNYLDHLATHTGVKRNVCPVCQRHYTFGNSLKRHIRDVHRTVAVHE